MDVGSIPTARSINLQPPTCEAKNEASDARLQAANIAVEGLGSQQVNKKMIGLFFA